MFLYKSRRKRARSSRGETRTREKGKAGRGKRRGWQKKKIIKKGKSL